MYTMDFEKNTEAPTDNIKAETSAVPAKFIASDEFSDPEIALKVNILVERLKEYKEKLISLREKNLEAAKSNFEKSRELEKLKLEKEHLEAELSENIFSQRKGPGGGIITITNKSKKDEEYRRRMEIRKELAMGIALVEGDFTDFIGTKDAKKNLMQIIIQKLLNFVNKFIILKNDLKRIESRYDKSISSYFSFYKFTVNLSLLILYIYCYLLIEHILNYKNSLLSICQSSFCFTLYYSFGLSEKFVYALSFCCMIGVSVVFSIFKYIRADQISKTRELYGGDDLKIKQFSAIVFNSWQWSINTEIDSADQSANVSNLISNSLKEYAKKREAANRTAKQKTALIVKRIIGNIIFVVLLACSWSIIGLLAITQNDITNSFKNSSQAIAITMQFLPKLGISLANSLFPALTLKITNLESWDSSSFIIKLQIVRLYLAKVLNIVLYALLNLELATSNAWFGDSQGRIPFEPSIYNCREDQAGLNLMTLVVSEFVASKIIPLSMSFLYWMLSKCLKNYNWKKEIRVSQQVIDLIYFQGLIWITFPFFPYIAILGPVFLYLDFKFKLMRLNYLQAKPIAQTQSSEIMIIIMRMFNLTLVFMLGYFGYFLTVNITHGTYGSGVNCGAFISNLSANESVISAIESTVILDQIWVYVFTYTPVFWIIFLLCITKIIFLRNHLNILKEYYANKQIETEHQIEDLKNLNTRLMKQNELNKKLD